MNKALITAGLVLILALSLLGLPACDSSSSGGGATTTSGYVTSDLAGVWHYKFVSGVQGRFSLDAQGECHSYTNSIFPGTAFGCGGRFTVASDGSFLGKIRVTAAILATPITLRWGGQMVNTSYMVGTAYQSIPLVGGNFDFSARKE